MSNEPQSASLGAQSEQAAQTEKLVTRGSLVVDAILVAAFFVFMFSLIRPHVPTEDSLFIAIWGGGAAACMSGVFWLAVQMFRVVLRAQLVASRRK